MQDKSLRGNKMHWGYIKQPRKSGNYLYFVRIEGVEQYFTLRGNKIKYINAENYLIFSTSWK